MSKFDRAWFLPSFCCTWLALACTVVKSVRRSWPQSDTGLFVMFIWCTVIGMHRVCLWCVQTVQQRGAAVIAARKLSSAMSAAKATCDHLRDWWHGTKDVSNSVHPFSCVFICNKNKITRSKYVTNVSVVLSWYGSSRLLAAVCCYYSDDYHFISY